MLTMTKSWEVTLPSHTSVSSRWWLTSSFFGPPHKQLTNAQWKRVASIEGADFTDALMRKDVEASLCKLAKGTNPVTGTETRESLHCR